MCKYADFSYLKFTNYVNFGKSIVISRFILLNSLLKYELCAKYNW